MLELESEKCLAFYCMWNHRDSFQAVDLQNYLIFFIINFCTSSLMLQCSRSRSLVFGRARRSPRQSHRACCGCLWREWCRASVCGTSSYSAPHTTRVQWADSWREWLSAVLVMWVVTASRTAPCERSCVRATLPANTWIHVITEHVATLLLSCWW